MSIVLVTGSHGFLGRHTAMRFKKMGYRVLGIGHGHWDFERSGEWGIDQWIEADVDYYSLTKIKEKLDCVVHCAGGSSVGYSVNYPIRDFHRTVTSSINVLEYIRLHQPQTRFIYPSSAAVYGRNENKPLCESTFLEPVSPYGFHKKMVEDLCRSYSLNFGVSVAVVRFFSIYGAGLKKQLLWDTCNRFSQVGKKAVFFGKGSETRDWIHVEDAAELLFMLSQVDQGMQIINGGSGKARTVREVIEFVATLFGAERMVEFNQVCREGDPQYYWADISEALAIGWKPTISFDEGVRIYVDWHKGHTKD